MIAIGYIRASTEEQALGPEAQRAALTSYCQRTGTTLAATYEDLGVSGAAPMDRRPGMVAALAALSHVKGSVLLVAKRDRLARDVMSAAFIEKAARDAGARVVSVAGEGTDSSDADDPSAQLMRRIIDAFAEYERMLIKARTRAALAVKRARGQRIGALPLGSTVGADNRTLTPDRAEASTVALIRELRARGLPLRDIVDYLNEEKRPCRGDRWHLTTVARVCRRTPT